MKKFKTPSILIFFWFSIFLLTKDLSLMEEVKVCLDRSDCIPYKNCDECTSSVENHNNQTFYNRYYYHMVGFVTATTVLSVGISAWYLHNDPYFFWSMFDPECPWCWQDTFAQHMADHRDTHYKK